MNLSFNHYSSIHQLSNLSNLTLTSYELRHWSLKISIDSLVSMPYEGLKMCDGLSEMSLFTAEYLVVWEKIYCLLVWRVFEGWWIILNCPLKKTFDPLIFPYLVFIGFCQNCWVACWECKLGGEGLLWFRHQLLLVWYITFARSVKKGHLIGWSVSLVR